MLQTIMETEADFNIMHQAGVSESGINFVSQLLNRDPFFRPTEKECFQHPWIANVPDVDEYEDDDILADGRECLSVIGEDVEEELDASQLSIHDPEFTYGIEAEESSSNEVLAKRPRIENIPTDVRYPSLPQIESFQDGQMLAEHHARRLFGEVDPAALRSSHALGDTASWDGDMFDEEFASSGESRGDERSVYSVMSLPEQLFGGAAPSLMDAENLVGRLNVNSTHPMLHPQPQAGPVNEITTQQISPGNPKESAKAGSTPTSHDDVPSNGNDVDTNPKAPKDPRRIGMDLPDTASEGSSGIGGHVSRQDVDPAQESAPSADIDIELATTLDAQTGQAILDQLRSAELEVTQPIVHQPVGPFIRGDLPAPEFATPPKVLGRLKSVPGSIFDLNIRLENRMTSWGRGPEASIRHADCMDARIPAYALEITFWAPGLERKIAEGQDWLQVPGVMTVLSTKTRKCIWVNGKELRRGGPDGLQFGKLYSGDIITIYQHREEYLQLRCEFYHGDSAQPRPAQESEFVVRQALVGMSDGASNRLPLRPPQVKEGEK